MKKLSIIIPVYNEERFIEDLINKVLKTKLPKGVEKEIIVVNDNSTDKTKDIIYSLKQKHKNIKIINHKKNLGKGASVKTGIKHSSGDIILIQDGDLEYDPDDYKKLIVPILSGEAEVVFGSRYLYTDKRRVFAFWHTLANKILTTISNMFSNLNLTDMETCYKVFKKEVIKDIDIEEKGFGIEPEITAKIATLFRNNKIRIYEVPISYTPRGYNEGKKIKISDAIYAVWAIIKYNSTFLAKFIRYGISGLIAAITQFITIYTLVNFLGFTGIILENIANAISIETSLLVAYILHARFTFKSQITITNFLQFHASTLFSIAIRIIAFFILSLIGIDYKTNTLINIGIAVLLNYRFYDRIFTLS